MDYRAFVVDAGGHVVGCHDIACDNDAEALELAALLVRDNDIEVWQLGRIVGKLAHKHRQFLPGPAA
jgi:hypothetical protein